MSKMQCRIVIPQVLDENLSLFLTFSKGNGYENNEVDMVILLKFSPKFSILQRESYLSKFNWGILIRPYK